MGAESVRQEVEADGFKECKSDQGGLGIAMQSFTSHL